MHEKRTPSHPGIRVRHQERCRTRTGGGCSCTPTYEAWAYSAREMRKLRRSFPSLAAARAWRAEAQTAIHRGSLRTPLPTTLREAAATWLEGARDGLIRTRSGDPYKPATIRGYETALRRYILPELGASKLSAIGRADLQQLVERLAARRCDPSTIRNALMPLRAIYRRALARGEITLNPTGGLELPAVRGRRERIASPAEAAALLTAVAEKDRALWATAFYAGLRRGELMALRWEDVDLEQGVLRVERSWDLREGIIEPKSRAGRRTVPIPAILREHLAAHALRTGRRAGLVLGRTATRPFGPETLRERALSAWRRAGLTPITLHEARHTFASLMIAAGVNPKALSTYMGHASITITLDCYGHLMPGSENEAAGLLDRYLNERSAAL